MLLGRRLPRLDGEVRLDGPQAAITIRRDGWGVPHIEAATERDALFALGFCQGQDRAGQLEVLWRLARGRLAEWVGPGGLPMDRLSRCIGFRRSAEGQWPVLAGWVREWMEAFAAGINAAQQRGGTRRPHEWAILGGRPSPWDGIDLLAVLKLQSFLLPSNWDAELLRLRMLYADGPQAVQDLEPAVAAALVPSPGPAQTQDAVGSPRLPESPRLTESTDVTAGRSGSGPFAADDARIRRLAAETLERLQADLDRLRGYVGGPGGSNNWVIAGRRTASGRPLLANDPHLAPFVPPPWYLAHVRTPQWEVAGAMFAGSLGFAIGHNGYCAWGVTAALSDNTDLFVETLGPDRRSVRDSDGTFVPCTVREEVIQVRWQGEVVETVLETPRGPIVTPLDGDLPVALSIRGVWQEALPVVGFLRAPLARSFEEFRAAFAEWPLLPLNVVYADAGGTIGWQMIGQLPRRRGGYGLLPAPADRPDSGWEADWLPFKQLPAVVDPPQGFWATANHDPRLDLPDWPAHLGSDYCDPYRVRAVREALAARDGWTLEDCLELQRDTRSIPWEEVREVVLGLRPATAEAAEALRLLEPWDGRMDIDSPAAAVFEFFLMEMLVRVVRRRAPKSWEAALRSGDANLAADRRIGHLVRLLRHQPPGWFDDWPREMLDALTQAVRRLRAVAGPGSAYWAWGHVRPLRLEHLLFGKQRGLAAVFNVGPVPCAGDANTISQAAVCPTDPARFTHNIANLRAAFDLADLGRSRFVLCGGQSGNPCSPHYDDQLPLWQRGEAIPIPWTQAEVIRAARHTLRLLPATAPTPQPSG